MRQRYARPANDTLRASPCHGSISYLALAMLHSKANFAVFDQRFKIRFLSRLLRQPKRFHERHITAAGGIRTFHCSCPKPGNDGRLLPRFRNFHLRIKMSDFCKGFLFEQVPIIGNIIRQSLRSVPIGSEARLCLRIHWRLINKLRWNFNHSLINHYRYRIKVMCIRLQP